MLDGRNSRRSETIFVAAVFLAMISLSLVVAYWAVASEPGREGFRFRLSTVFVTMTLFCIATALSTLVEKPALVLLTLVVVLVFAWSIKYQ